MTLRKYLHRLTKPSHEPLSCLVLLILIAITWTLLHERRLDTTDTVFVYRDF